MVYEVELKFPVADARLLWQRLAAEGVELAAEEQQCDRYYNHPSRDFAQSREALRVRQVEGQALVTYKGPRLPGAVKAREELEWSLGPDDPRGERLAMLLERLGFRPVARVRKHRQSANLNWGGRSVTVAVDQVEELGTFVELELLAEADDVEAARGVLLGVAGRLGLSGAEPRSYLTLLLSRRGQTVDRAENSLTSVSDEA
jgi:adenylate cyclase class 2